MASGGDRHRRGAGLGIRAAFAPLAIDRFQVDHFEADQRPLAASFANDEVFAGQTADCLTVQVHVDRHLDD